MTIKSWFPTSIYQAELQAASTDKLNRELVEEAFQIMDYDDEGKAWCKKNYVGGYTSYSSLASLHQMTSTFMKLEKKINAHVSTFAKHLEFDLLSGKLAMCDCWVNIMPAQCSHSLHIHPLSCISGTYYVQVPKNSASIVFRDPRQRYFMAAPPKKQPSARHNKQVATYKPKPGHLVLFESWLEHEVPASNTKTERISISFNYHWV